MVVSLILSGTGWTVVHSACLLADNVNIVKYLLSQEICKRFILCKGGSPKRRHPSLPQDIARDTVVTIAIAYYMYSLKALSESGRIPAKAGRAATGDVQ